MQTVLIAGAGKSSAYLIDYMLQNAKQKWKVVVMDANAEMIAEKLGGHPKGEAAVIDIHNESDRQALVKQADIVLSLMPHNLHYLLAQDCVKFGKNLITSSYVNEEIAALNQAAKDAGIMMMCEMGLDPGIDHMSANAIIHGVQRVAGTIISFKSYCGGLVAPESDDNPWHYKIAWNPRNILLAGKAGAVWLENGKHQELHYNELYANAKKVKVDDLGYLSYYPNRDSMKYLDLYHLPDVKTFMRATLRHPNFMKGWEVIVRAQLTNELDQYDIPNASYASWIAEQMGVPQDEQLKLHFKEKYQVEDKEMKQLEWLGLFDNRRINSASMKLSSADILQTLIEEKWKMRALDKDMVVMQHQVDYERKGMIVKLKSALVATGENRQYSVMAKSVGLPMAILAKKILLGELQINDLHGVQIPTMPEIYVPVLKELQKYGIEFVETIE